MKRIINSMTTKLLGVGVLMLLLTGCFDDITKVYDGPPVVEFAQYDQPFSPGNNWTSTINFGVDDESASVELSYLLQLISPHFDQETYIGFTTEGVDQGNSTAAIEGTHFEVLTSGGQAVFPASDSFSSIDVEVMSDNLEPGESVRFEIELTEGDELLPAENYKTFTVIINRAAE